ncbi:hypothetical protein JCM11641_000929 [Rhodosporidiobolus odoratus]
MGLFKPPHLDRSNKNNWRFRYHGTWLALGCLTAFADFALAVFVAFYNFGVPGYLYGTVIAVSALEGLYISVVIALIEFHVGVKTHADVGKELGPMWCGSLTINLVFFIGASSEASGDAANSYKAGAAIAAVSQILGLIMVILSGLLHILLLTDPNPEAHGFHPNQARKHRHKHRSRHKNGTESDDPEADDGYDKADPDESYDDDYDADDRGRKGRR